MCGLQGNEVLHPCPIEGVRSVVVVAVGFKSVRVLSVANAGVSSSLLIEIFRVVQVFRGAIKGRGAEGVYALPCF